MNTVTDDIRVEQCIRYLLKRENHFTLSQSNFGVSIYSACAGDGPKFLGKGETLTEALLAACETVRERSK